MPPRRQAMFDSRPSRATGGSTRAVLIGVSVVVHVVVVAALCVPSLLRVEEMKAPEPRLAFNGPMVPVGFFKRPDPPCSGPDCGKPPAEEVKIVKTEKRRRTTQVVVPGQSPVATTEANTQGPAADTGSGPG